MDDRRRLLMIVEDDGATRTVLGGLFSRRGWEVRPATNLAEALDLLDDGLRPDYLILDLKLPDGDGEAVLGRVREGGLGTQVLVCTGDTDPMRRMRVKELDPDIFLSKPVEANVLFNLCDGRVRLG